MRNLQKGKTMKPATEILMPADFRRCLRVPAGAGRIVPFAQDTWMDEMFRGWDAGFVLAAGLSEDLNVKRCSWAVLPRGSGKTMCASAQTLWLLLYGRPGTFAVSYAADQEQAGLIVRSIKGLITANPWLRRLLNVNQWEVTATNNNRLQVCASDVGSSFGATPSAVFCDEVSHWPESAGEKLWESAFSSTAKTPTCALLATMNAGMMTHWSHRLHENAQKDPDWNFFSMPIGQRASWIREKDIERQRRMLAPSSFSRLWENRWVPAGSNYLSADDIAASVSDTHGPVFVRDPEMTYFAGVDLAAARDHGALVLVGRERRTGRIVLCQAHDYPPVNGRVDLLKMRDKIIEIRRTFRARIICDDYGASFLQQDLEKRGTRIELIHISSKHHDEFASKLLQAFADRRITLYRDPILLRQLAEMNFKENYKGQLKLDPERTKRDGHGDVAMSFAFAVSEASAPKKNFFVWYDGSSSRAPDPKQEEPKQEQPKQEQEQREQTPAEKAAADIAARPDAWKSAENIKRGLSGGLMPRSSFDNWSGGMWSSRLKP
jgi:phage terminase large subunit-like protein